MSSESITAGQVFGRLTAVCPAPKSTSGHSRWEFRCDCGGTKAARVIHVLAGRTTSCGCLRIERVRVSNARRTGISPGDRFGRLVAVTLATGPGSHGDQAAWRFDCDCGNTTVAQAAKVKSGHTRSCGCLSADLSSSRLMTHGDSVGRRGTKEYRAWKGLRQRCLDPHCAAYLDYGGRGITVCDRWQGPDGFANFLADVGRAPSPAHTIDRLDNSRGYEPGNCAWRTRVEQMNNRRGNVRLTHGGETLTLAEWAKRVGLKRFTLAARLRMGWPPGKALFTPVKNERPTQRTD